MPAIKRIVARPFRLPLKGSLRWGKSSELAALEHVLLEVELSDGSVGRSEVPPRPTIYGETVGTVLAGLEYLRPRLLGLEAEDTEAIQRVLAGFPNHHTLKGGLDIAIWEAWAHSEGQELWQVLEPAQGRIKVSYILGIADEKEMLEDARLVYEAGVRVLKVKVGRDLVADLSRIALLREQFPEMELYADANESLDPNNAEGFMRAWQQAGLLYVEEPLPIAEVLARKRLKKAQLLPIIADDSAFTLRDLWRECQLDTFDVLNIKPARTGYTQSLEMLALARAEEKRVMLGSQALSSFGAFQTALLAFQEGVSEPSELAFHLKAEGGFCAFPKLQSGWLEWGDLMQSRFDEAAFGQFAV